MATEQTISMNKGQHHFAITYDMGDEKQVLDYLVEMVNRPELRFDWFDAAVLSHQLGQRLGQEVKAYLPKGEA